MATLDPTRYTSRAFMRREWRGMWRRVWLMAAHESELPSPGSYRVLSLGPESVLVVRQDDGSARAFYNVCVHRGSPLCGARSGTQGDFRCAYHGWRYDRSGALVEAPGVEAQDLPPGLTPLPTERALGFVWFNMDPEPEPLDRYLGGVRTLLEPYRLGGWHLTQDLEVELPCNWKLSCDAHNESYHVHRLHPQVLPILDDTAVTYQAVGHHSHMVVPFGTPSGRLGDGLPGALAAWAEGYGVDATRFADDRQGLRRALEAAARARAPAGADGLSDDQLLDTHQFHIFPNLQLNQRADELLLFRHWPHRSDPERMVFEQQSFRRDGTDTDHHPPRRRRLAPGDGGFGPVTDADVTQLIRQQPGLSSAGLERMVLTREEQAIGHMHRTLDRFLETTPASTD